jgi:cytochrome c oxidase subunit I
MTVAPTDRPIAVRGRDWRRPGGLVGWIATTDHKRLGLLMIVTAFFYFVLGGIVVMVMRTELLQPGMQVVSKDEYNQLFTIHGSTMIYLVITPLAIGFGVYLIPLQIGAAELVAPRLALLGYWVYAAGGGAMYLGFATAQGAGKAGWTSYFPLSDTPHTPGNGMDLWVLGVLLAVLGMLLVGAVVLWTIFRLRAPGMTMMRIPPFAWSQVATCLMVVTSFPVLVFAMAALEEQRLVGTGIYSAAHGPETWQHLFWFYGHPVVYVMFFPFVGAVAEVAATFSRRRFFGYSGFTISLLLFAALSMAVWGHHMFATAYTNNHYFSLTSTLLAIPAGLEYFAILGTLIGGAIVLTTAMWFVVGFLLLFLLGGLSGIFIASPTLDYHVTDTYFIVAHFHYTLVGGSLMGLFAGIYYWFPKATGALLREGLGKLHFALLFVGSLVTFFPQFVLGEEGMRRRIADYPARFETLNLVSSIGSYVVATSILVFFVNVFVSLCRRRPAGPDPWGGHTLEWWTTSPPPRVNFPSALPPVRSYAPLFDLAEERREA